MAQDGSETQMTIQELLVRDGTWPDINGPLISKNPPVWSVTIGDHWPRDEWYKWDHKIGGPKGYQASLLIYIPADKPKGQEVYIDESVMDLRDTIQGATIKRNQ